MKNYFKIAATIVMIMLGAAICVVAQKSETFEDQTFYNLKSKAESLRRDRILRVTDVEETLQKGSKVPTKYTKYINEIVPPNRSHFVVEKKTEKGIERTEYIDIGRDRFVKENKGAWQVFKPTGRGVGSGGGSGDGSGEQVKIESSSKNTLMKGVMLNKKKADYYEILITYKYIYPTRTEINYVKHGYWFDEEGKLIRNLEENYDDKTSDRKTTDYEYDLKIEIAAPIK